MAISVFERQLRGRFYAAGIGPDQGSNQTTVGAAVRSITSTAVIFGRLCQGREAVHAKQLCGGGRSTRAKSGTDRAERTGTTTDSVQYNPSVNSKQQIAALEDIGLRLGDTQILRHAKLTLEAGEKVGLLGPNGSGKTTLLRVLATLQRPTSGSGVVLDADLGSDDIYRVRSRITLVGHLPGLFAELSLEENLGFASRLLDRGPERAEQALVAVGLGGAMRRRADQCSKGMLRRAELARVLVAEPKMLLLDEAHAGLDESSAGLVDIVADRVVAGGGAVILVSHEPERLNVDRAIRMTDGSLEAVS